MDQRARWARRAGLVAGGLSCGILVALSVPPFGFWPLAWLGFAGLALLARGARPGARALAGAGAGLGQYGIGLWWVQEFSGYGCAVLIVLSTLYVAGALLAIPGRRWGIFVLPAAFVLDDWARYHFPLQGFPLG
ncbi:MAG TPA: hypothetical protein VMW49_05685, partial [Candidatus Dormibacteraeota bacterium]|nr:hypothetical protein [Candidatus Dormibacteraeota bacterium]